MLNGYGGEDVNISPGQAVNLVKDYTIDNGIKIKNALIIVFLQSASSKTVLGTEKIKL